MFKYTLLSDRSPSCVADEQIQLVCLWEDAEDKEDTEVCGWMAGCIHAFSRVYHFSCPLSLRITFILDD